MPINPVSDHIFLTVFEKSASALLVKADTYFTVFAVSDSYLQFAQANRKDVVGKSIFDAFPQIRHQQATVATLRKAFEQVIELKETTYLQSPVYELYYSTHAELEHQTWTITNKPILDEDGQVAYIIHTPANITEQVNREVARQAHLQSNALFRNLVMQAPIAIGLCKGHDLVVETANKYILDIWGKTDEIIGKKLEIALPELEGQPFLQFLRDVLLSGMAHYGYETPANLVRNGRLDTYYFNFVYYPLKEQDSVTGIIVVATEVTEQVRVRQALEESERQFRNLVLQSPVAMGIMRGPEMVVEVYNDEILKLWSKTAEEVTGRKLLDALPDLADQQYPALLKRVYETGIPYSAQETPLFFKTAAGTLSYYIDFSYRPLFDMDGHVSGIMVTANNVTSQVEARHRVEVAEERIRLATEATGLGTFDLDLANDRVAYSPRLAEMFGYPDHEQLTHQTLLSLIHPDDRRIVDQAFETAIEKGIYFYEARNIWPDNSVHWIRTHGNMIFGDNHKPVRLVGTVLDVTSERHLINELMRSEENMRLAAEAADLGTFDWNVTDNILQWDGRHRQLFGIEPHVNITYHLFLSIVYPDDRETVEKAIKYTLNKNLTGGEYDTDFRIIKQDTKSLRWMRAKGRVLFNDHDVPLRFIGTVIDITDRKQDEIRKNDFIAMASHELKTPLTSLKAYIQLLHTAARRSENHFFSNSLQKAEHQVDKMTRLIYGFLDLSKIESGRLQLEMQRFDINEAINEAIADVRPIAQNHKIIFETADQLFVFADREKISQVLINLLNNAVKYSPKDTTVTVTARQVDSIIEVMVKDQGIGINSYDIQNIFQRFYRVQSEKMKGFSGFGIGLYLAAEIINLHHGKIGVESTQGEGSTFYIKLPQA